MTTEEVVSRLVDSCPETQPIVDEHLEDFDNEILLHLLIVDVRRFAIAAFEAGSLEVLTTCLGVVATGMSDGDDDVQNAIGVSFVEDTLPCDPAMQSYIATWPEALQNAAVQLARNTADTSSSEGDQSCRSGAMALEGGRRSRRSFETRLGDDTSNRHEREGAVESSEVVGADVITRNLR